MNKYIIKSVSDLLVVINEIILNERDDLWFRGQPSACFELEPNLLRGKREILPENSEEELWKKYTKEIHYEIPSFKKTLNEFKRKAHGFVEKIPENDFQWMFLMQHYGAPTRLLDWSTNILIALYFAIPSIDHSKSYALDEEECEANKLEFMNSGYCKGGSAIYVINPAKVNSISSNVDEIIDVNSFPEKWDHYIHPNESPNTHFPICISAPHIDKRIRSQSGMFTLHGSRAEPLDWYTALSKTMFKIYIPKNCWISIKQELKNMGVTTSFVFPDLEGIAKEIKETVFQDYHKN